MQNNEYQNESYSSITQIMEYMDKLSHIKDKIIIIAVKDTAGYWFNKELQNKLRELGFTQNLINKFMVGYIGIIYNSTVIYESPAEKDTQQQYSGIIALHRFDIKSKPFSNGNIASIKIDSAEYAVNSRGINIVVYNYKETKVEDSVSFDTHVKEYTCKRIERISLGKRHYDIALVGCWWGANYGSCLNGYAVYKILKSFGLSVLMLHKHDAVENDWEITNTHNARFIKKFYPENEVSPNLSREELSQLNNYCDMFLTGSDQIWNYGINKIFNMVFMLNFVDDTKKKLSFGTSFGHEKDGTPKNVLPYTQSLLRRFQAISVREQSGAKICNEVYGVKAKVVVEPVFCLTVHEYDQLVKRSDLEVPSKPYILTYILDPTEKKRQAILDYSKISGMDIVNVLDGDPRVYEKNRKLLNLPNTMGKIGAEDFLKLYKYASFVITDSFHGTAFSIIYNKKFLSIINYRRGSVRFGDILGKFGLLDRLVQDPENIPISNQYLKNIDFSRVNKIIEKERKESLEWLKDVLEKPIEKLESVLMPKNTVTVKLNKTMCSGCGACINICPKDALSLCPDDLGYYRSTINPEKCIDCGRCVKVCPALNLPENHNNKHPRCYEFVAASDEIVEKSSSGGVFSALAEQALKRKGVVAGAAWKDDFSVGHIIVKDKKELFQLQKSKYLQSYIGNVFRDIKMQLVENKFVLFSGCPCQVAGLKSYLGKEYDNLLLVDLLCGNAPSTMFFKKYLDDEFPEGVLKYQFRHKARGWNSNCIKVELKDGRTIIRQGGAEDGYQRVYHNHVMCAVHCERCKYQNAPRFGDITIGDFWWIDKKDPDIETKQGVSAVLCNNEKGQQFFDSIPEEQICLKKEVPVEWLSGNGFVLGNSNWCSPKRDVFYSKIKEMAFTQAVNYSLKPNHGRYRPIYSDMPLLLQYDSDVTHFNFNASVWEEHIVHGRLALSVKEGMSKVGNYAAMSMYKSLEKNKTYDMKIKFYLKTNSHILNFHVKDSGSNIYQMIYSYHIPEHYDGNAIELSIKFRPNSNIYDEFMIGASQISGPDNYISFDYINITEAE